MIDTKALIEKLKPLNPEKIILFGSYAHGRSHGESDIDVLIIQETTKPPKARVSDVLKVIWGNIPHIEPYILTPNEFARAVRENRFFITQEVLKKGKVIYEKN